MCSIVVVSNDMLNSFTLTLGQILTEIGRSCNFSPIPNDLWLIWDFFRIEPGRLGVVCDSVISTPGCDERTRQSIRFYCRECGTRLFSDVTLEFICTYIVLECSWDLLQIGIYWHFWRNYTEIEQKETLDEEGCEGQTRSSGECVI